MAWTEKMVEDLKIMWKQGLTTGEIGKRLGVSKNSIVGKVHRLQLDARPSPIKKKDEQPAAENVSRPAAEPAPEKTKEKKADKKDLPHSEATGIQPAPVRAAAPKTVGTVQLTDLDNHTCRWPLGDPKDENFHFCGKKVKIGQTYCEEHAALAYIKPNKK